MATAGGAGSRWAADIQWLESVVAAGAPIYHAELEERIRMAQMKVNPRRLSKAPRRRGVCSRLSGYFDSRRRRQLGAVVAVLVLTAVVVGMLMVLSRSDSLPAVSGQAWRYHDRVLFSVHNTGGTTAQGGNYRFLFDSSVIDRVRGPHGDDTLYFTDGAFRRIPALRDTTAEEGDGRESWVLTLPEVEADGRLSLYIYGNGSQPTAVTHTLSVGGGTPTTQYHLNPTFNLTFADNRDPPLRFNDGQLRLVITGIPHDNRRAETATAVTGISLVGASSGQGTRLAQASHLVEGQTRISTAWGTPERGLADNQRNYFTTLYRANPTATNELPIGARLTGRTNLSCPATSLASYTHSSISLSDSSNTSSFVEIASVNPYTIGAQFVPSSYEHCFGQSPSTPRYDINDIPSSDVDLAHFSLGGAGLPPRFFTAEHDILDTRRPGTFSVTTDINGNNYLSDAFAPSAQLDMTLRTFTESLANINSDPYNNARSQNNDQYESQISLSASVYKQRSQFPIGMGNRISTTASSDANANNLPLTITHTIAFSNYMRPFNGNSTAFVLDITQSVGDRVSVLSDSQRVVTPRYPDTLYNNWQFQIQDLHNLFSEYQRIAVYTGESLLITEFDFTNITPEVRTGSQVRFNSTGGIISTSINATSVELQASGGLLDGSNFALAYVGQGDVDVSLRLPPRQSIAAGVAGAFFGGDIFQWTAPRVAGLNAIDRYIEPIPGTNVFWWTVIMVSVMIVLMVVLYLLTRNGTVALMAVPGITVVSLTIGILPVWLGVVIALLCMILFFAPFPRSSGGTGAGPPRSSRDITPRL
jgi:hypothetical protein